jgi:uncharacterized metal-binding protein
MPSGKTHDLITVVLAAPTFAVAWAVTRNFVLATLVTGATLFGGLMFGPDLDVQSRQYARWGVFRFLWLPYKICFRHRSRWSHGIIFGTLIRVLYFIGMIALVAASGVYLRAMLSGGALPTLTDIAQAWRAIEAPVTHYVGDHVIWAVLVGLWWGAASHTLTDVGWSMARKSSEIF